MESLVTAITAVILTLMPFWKSEIKQARADKLAHIIVEETQAAAKPIDPYLVTVIIFKESSFRARVKGPRGEVGLMQVMPGSPMTPFFTKKNLTDPRTNIKAGIAHLQYWREKCGSDDISVWVSAYNAGRCTRNKYGRRIKKLYCKVNPLGKYCLQTVS
jgi:soluble lytic murein transglycosylase-like protein